MRWVPRSQSQTDLAARARIYHVRSGHGLAFLECRTYRFRVHSMFDPELYRDKKEVEQWQERCPIDAFVRRLAAAGVPADSMRDEIEREVATEIADVVLFAEAGTWEPVEHLALDVYARTPDVAAPAKAGRGSGASSRGEEGGGGPAKKGVRANAATRRIAYRDALREGPREALLRDERMFLVGEDVGRYGGTYAVSRDLLSEFGDARVRDALLAESAFVRAGIGAAVNGMRPIIEVMTVNCSLLALDQIMNNAVTLRHKSGGQFSVPVVIRMTTGGGRQLATQQSHSLEGWYAHIPGPRIVAPATHDDARGMLLAALEDPDPVLIFEHALLLGVEGELSEPLVPVDIDRGAVRRGGDVSLITYGGMVHKTLAAATELAAEGIEAEVLDLRSLRPLDDAAIVAAIVAAVRPLLQ